MEMLHEDNINIDDVLSSSEISNSMQHECGVFGCVAVNREVVDNGTLNIASILTLGLTGLQHRGQESAGIVVSQGDSSSQPLRHHRGMGLVSQVFTDDILASQLAGGRLGIGHTRYSTVGGSLRANCQPFLVETTYGQFALAHNGELVNSKELKRLILRRGVGLSTGTDSEVMTQLLCATPNCGEPNEINWVDRIKAMMQLTLTSYSVLILYHDRVYAVRDPFGNRPLTLGKICIPTESSTSSSDGTEEFGGTLAAYVVSSESGVFRSFGGEIIRDILPGEIVEIRMTKPPHGSGDDASVSAICCDMDTGGYPGVRSLGIVHRPGGVASALCIFEYVYFARPDSYLEGQQVHSVRFRSGCILARESPVEADLISVIPESATPAAMGYAQGTGIPFVEVLSRNRYVGRTFIQPSTHLRQLGVATKFGVLADNFRDKRIVLVDDSIVRGTTIKPIVTLLRRNGAKEVHVRVASPPIKHPCYMGINIPTRSELIANSMDAMQLAEFIGADSVRYLSVEGLHAAVEMNIPRREVNNVGHCNACLTGKYPVPIDF